MSRHTAADHPLDSPTPLCPSPDQSSDGHSAVASVINSIPGEGGRLDCVTDNAHQNKKTFEFFFNVDSFNWN